MHGGRLTSRGSQILVTNEADVFRFQERPDARADERVELRLEFIERRVRVDFRSARRQTRNQFQKEFLVDATVLQQAKNIFRVPDAQRIQVRARVAAEEQIDERVAATIKPVATREPGVQPEWIFREPEMSDAPAGCVPAQDAKHGRMQVHVQVAVDVVEAQTGALEFFKLREQFGGKLGLK